MDEIQKLYDALSKRGYYTKSFDDFKVQFQDKGYQDKVYNVVSRDGLYTKSKDEFLSKYSVSPQKDTFKKKEDSEVVLETGGEVGTSEPPLRKEKVLDYLASLKTPPVVTGKAPIIPKEKAILPVQKPKKIDTSFGLTKEKIKVDISPKVEEISFDADPIGLAQRKASETKNLQEATDYLSAAEVFKQLSVPSGYQAYVRSASPLIDKNTATGSVILERGGRYGATTEGLRQIKAPDLSTANEEFIRQNIIPQIERAAVIYKVRANPSFEKELKAVNTSVDDPNLRSVLGSAKMGSIMEEFLNNSDVASFAKEENPNLSIALQYARDKNFDLNKEWGISSVANKVSREFERSEKRGGAFAPFATESLKKDIDEVAKQKLNPEEYGIYQTYIKGNEEQYLDTPSFLGGVAEGGKGVFEGILNTIEKVTGFAPPKEDVIRNKWREEAMNVSANPEGLRNIVAESGKVGGLVAALFGTGSIIRGGLGIPAAGTSLPATTLTNIADATNVITAFLGDMIDEGVIKYPTEPVKAYTSAIFNTLVFAAMGKDIFPGAKVKSAFSKVQPEVEQVVKNLANGSISREAARQELNTIGKKAIDIAAAGVSQNAKVSAELTGLSVLNEGLDILMDMDEDKLRKYYPEGVHGDTFKTMFLSNALVSSIAGYGKVKRDNTIARESIYEAASNPKRYSRIIEDLVIKDPNITKEELLNNLSFAVETKRLLDQRGIPPESQKQYLVKALGERVAIAEKEKIADSTLRKEAEDKIKQAQAEKEAILTAPEEAPELPAAEMQPLTLEVKKPEGFVPALKKLGYTADEIAKMTIEQQQDIVINKTEPARAETTAKLPTEAAPEITDTEYTEFIDKGIVTPERLNDIAQKVKNKEALSEREQAIFTDKTADINKIIAGEVALEAKPQIYEFEGKRYEVTDSSITEIETGNLLPVSKIDKIRKEGKLIEEAEAAPEVPAAPEMEDMPELPTEIPPSGFRPVEGIEEFEVVGPKKEAPETKEETDLRKRALNLDVEGNIRGEVLQYFIGGGTVNPEAIKRLFQRKDNNIRWNNMKPEERKTRIGFMKKGSPNIEALAEKLAGADRLDITQDFRNAIEDVLLGSGGKRDMAKELVESYDAEYKMMMRDKELTELGEEMEKQIQEFTAGLPEAQKKEIIKVLDEFRFEDGTIDWNRIEKEIEAIDPFSPEIILRLSPETQKIIQDGIKQIKDTGRVSRVPVETAPSPETLRGETRAAEATDKRTEAKNQLRDAFNDLMNLGVAYDPRSQAEKQVRLTKAIINVIKQEAIGAIEDLQKYIKDNLGFDISDKDAKYLLIESKKPEYAIQEPTAGEVPVQPEARVGGEVAAGVPPTEPPKVTPEGEAPREERKRTILNRIIDSPNTPESLKEEIRKKGLFYEPAKQAEATRLANAIIDAIGIDKAVEMADRGEFADVFGGMNTAVLTEAASRLTNDPVKQAQVLVTLDRASLWKGQDISYLQEFYTKNPLGVVIYQNAQRKESFREWSAQKDKSWQEALDVLKSEVEQLKKELAELRAKPEAEGVKTAKAKAAAARQKRASLIEKYKKNKGGGLTLSAGGLTKEGIEFVGEVAATYIQEGIANVEVLVQKVLADIKDVMGRDIPELRDQIETITRESFQKRKGQSVIDRIRKKLDGLSNKEKEEVIRKSYKKILDSGGLDFQDFKDIIADVLGRGPLTEEQANKLKQLTKTVNDLEVKSLEAQEKRTPQALAEYEKAQKEAAIARRELDRLFNSKPDLMRTITSLMQLNTLGVVSLVANVTYNVANQSLLRFPVGVINSLLDRSVSGVARLTGKRLNPETNILSRQVQREFFSKMALGFKEAGEQLYTGLNRQDYIQREVYGGQIRPLESMKNLYSFLKGEKKMNLANFVDNTLQATVGIPAEAVARLLSVGDKPFRYAAEGAMAAQISKALGIKGLDYDLFVKFPKAEAYRVYKSQGFSEAEALQKSEIVEKTIIQEGKRSTFQQDNFLNDKLSQLFNDTQSGAGAFVKSLTISPYVKIPSNAFWSNFNLLHPEIAMLQMFLLGDKARKLQEKDPVAAKMARREARYWFSHAAVGFSYLSAITSMVAAGVFTPGVTAEETKKEREGKQYYGKPGTINVMKLMAWLRGEDPTKVKEGYDVQIKWFGHIGYLGNAIARRELDLTEEQRNNRLLFTEFLLSNLTEDALEGLQSGVFSNTSALINALQSEFFLKRYGLNVIGMLSNVVHPASLAQLSRNELPYYSSTKADNFMDEVKNSFMQRSTFVRDLMNVDEKAKEIEKRRNRELSYAATDQEKIKIRSKYDADLFSLQTAKVGIWGDKLEKKDNFMMRWFGISKSNPDNFAQPLYDIVKRTNNISYFPPTIKPEIEDQGKKTDLNVKQTMELEMLVGQYRKNLVAPLLNDSVEIEGYGLWSEIEDNLKAEGLTAEEARVKADDIKLNAIRNAYNIGFEFGKQAFLDEHPEFRNEDYDKSEIQRRKKAMEKLNKELKKQF